MSTKCDRIASGDTARKFPLMPKRSIRSVTFVDYNTGRTWVIRERASLDTAEIR